MSAAPPAEGPTYCLYIDETGSAGGVHETITWQRYFGLVGVILRTDHEQVFGAALSDFKRAHVGCREPSNVPFHRTDAYVGKGAFGRFRDPALLDAAVTALVALVDATPFVLVCVVVDKFTHGSKTYRKVTDPYQYALQIMLERYVRWLVTENARGRVVAEARGKGENAAIDFAFRRTAHVGTPYVAITEFATRLTTRDLVILPKRPAVAGLELADLLARASAEDTLRSNRRIVAHGSDYDARLAIVAARRYRTRGGSIDGPGRILLD